jgi:hypothetical protein
MGEDGRAVALDMLVEPDAGAGPGWMRAWPCAATPSIKWEFLLPQFRSKINPHLAVTTRPTNTEVCCGRRDYPILYPS